jgi:hypothetical protein
MRGGVAVAVGAELGIDAVAVGTSVGAIEGRAVIALGATDTIGNAVVITGDASLAVGRAPVVAAGADVGIGATRGAVRGTFTGAGPAGTGDVISMVGTGRALASGTGVVEIGCVGNAEARSKPAMSTTPTRTPTAAAAESLDKTGTPIAATTG